MVLVSEYFFVAFLAIGVFSLTRSTYSVQIRLAEGKHSYEGRVEVKFSKHWESVTQHGWGLNESRVVCRMLGFPGVERFIVGLRFYRNVWMPVVKCTGHETNLGQCTKKPANYSRDAAGVVCLSHKEDVIIKPQASEASGGESDLKVRLLGPVRDDYISEGVVQVEREGRWGIICPTEWNYNEARVVCGQLGFPDASKQVSPQEITQEIDATYWMDKVSCTGVESSLVSCDHKGWGPHKCSENRAVRVTCTRFTFTKPSGIRLRSGAHMHEGRVEVKHRRRWGTVCDDNWDLLDASVACRSLGYGSAALALHRSSYGQGVGKIVMEDVDCKGREDNLLRCSKLRRSRSDCKNHYEDAAVKCHAPQLQNHKIRLRVGTNPMEGRVEVFHKGIWGSVCADDWHIEEAMVVCRQLDLGFAQKALIGNFSENPGILMSGVDCRHDEKSLYHCEHHGWRHVNCSSSRNTAGVVCVRELPDLVLNIKDLAEFMDSEFIPMHYLACPLEEKCLSKSASLVIKRRELYNRRLLRFTATAENRGLAHFRPRSSPEDWKWHKCHNHYHSMEAFTHYDLNLRNGSKAAEGHKASFCLEDAKCDAGIERKWNCTDKGDQGISPNCYDIYSWTVDCQWIDMTDLPRYGRYYIRVHVNPGNLVAESNFKNNIAKCELTSYYSHVVTRRCHIEDCESGVDTHGGNAGGACCIFPFRYKGKLHNSCIEGRNGISWCATTFDVDKDKKWGLCYV